MYYSMLFIRNEWGNFNVRAARKTPFKSLEAAKRAIIKSKHTGYVKMLGKTTPVWSN